MMKLRFSALYLVDLLVNIFCWAILDWVLPAFAQADGNLPKWLRWFQTHDANLDGVSPAGGYESRFVASTVWLRNAALDPRNAFCRYVLRILWLWRNNAYGFSYSVLGAVGPFELISFDSSTYLPNDRYPAQEGWSMLRMRGANGKEYFQYKEVESRGNGKCYETHTGWKLVGNNDRAMLVCRWTPFRTFETEPR